MFLLSEYLLQTNARFIGVYHDWSSSNFKTWMTDNLYIDSRRIGGASGVVREWGLRSSCLGNKCGVVRNDGYLNDEQPYVGIEMVARPAFNLNKSAILIASAATETASGGKKSGSEGADALAKVLTTKPNEWKLPLLDELWRFTTAVSDNSISFAYYGAKTGANEYISAVIVDDLGYTTVES